MKKTMLQKRGVEAAGRYLQRRGYEIVETGWACECGEIDVIARDGDQLVFVDVKTRTSIDEGMPPTEASDDARRSRELVAAAYLAGCDDVNIPVRFDNVSLLVIREDAAMLRHHINCLG